MRPEERKAVEAYLIKQYALDKPVLVRYVYWLNRISPIGTYEREVDGKMVKRFGFKAPELGSSFIRRRPVVDLIAESLPTTVLLNVLSLPIIYGLAILAGIRAARDRGGLFDYSSSTVFLAMWSVPVILTGTLAVGFLTNEKYVRWFPSNGLHDLFATGMPFLPSFGPDGWQRGYLLDALWHLVLPVVCLSYGSFAILSKLARGAVLDNIQTDYARTARAKGLAEKTVLYVHVLRNSLLPLITVAAGILPELISGAVIVETIFGISGMGRLAVEAVKQKDMDLVLAVVLMGTLLALIGNLIADLCYAIADPRVSYE
jgi:ABC-type dipeptide/oligopeptide/nickel transport system permease component